jgi:3-dehydrosphinganine reductase
MFPGNIDSPGYAEENRTKPRITYEIDSTSKPESPEVLAEGLIHGKWPPVVCVNPQILPFLAVQRGEFHITPDILGNIFRSSTIGATPHNNVLLDGVYASIGWVRT